MEKEEQFECQFCGNFHDTLEGHKEHVERIHYGELLRGVDKQPKDL